MVCPKYPAMMKIKEAIETRMALITNIDDLPDPVCDVFLGSKLWDEMIDEYKAGGGDVAIGGGTLFGGRYNVYKTTNPSIEVMIQVQICSSLA
jgi:hypothetical protein